MLHRVLLTLYLIIIVIGCERPPSSTDIVSVLDEGRLTTYRSSLPTESAVVAPTPMSSMVVSPGLPRALTPELAEGALEPVRTTLMRVVNLVDEVLAYAPTLYNIDTTELIWGPFQASTDFGTVALYISENPDYNPTFLEEEDPEGSPLQYIYAIMRGASYDLQTLTPIVSGGSTPDDSGEERGLGMVVFDYERERGFVQTHGEVAAEGCLPAGRFAAFYGRDAMRTSDGTDTGNDQSYVLGIFRSYVPKYSTVATPLDIDYFYGNILASTSTISFSNYGLLADFDGQPETVEQIAVKQAFFSYHRDGPAGSGRSEITAINETMTEQQAFVASECWDQSLARTYFTMGRVDGESYTLLDSHNTELTNCDLAFQAGFDAIGLPDAQSADSRLLDLLETLATEGIELNGPF